MVSMIQKIQGNLMKTFIEIIGWFGVVLIHASTLPTIIGVLNGTNPNLPELSLVLMVWFGLVCFTIRAISQGDTMYIVSNLIGFSMNSILLTIILL